MPDDPSILPKLLVLIVLILVNAFFAGTEMAVVSLNATKLRKMQEEGNKIAGKLLSMVEDSSAFLSTIQVAITLAGYLGAAFAGENFAPVLSSWLYNDLGFQLIPLTALNSVAIIIITIILSYFTLVFGELVPKRIALSNAESVSKMVAGPLNVFRTIAKPLVWFTSASANGLSCLFRIKSSDDRQNVSEEEIKYIVKDNDELLDDEKRMIHDILDLGDMTVCEVMQPRVDMMFVEDIETVRQAVDRMRGTGYSRLPVYHEEVDEVIGLVSYKDLIGPLLDGRIEDPVAEFMYEPLYVPETKNVLKLLSELQEARMQMAIVVDEYGGTDGLITMEDIIEEIVGEIADETDNDRDLIVLVEPNQWRVDGRFPVEDAVELGWPVEESDDYETLAGWIIHELDSVPRVGDELLVDGYAFKVVKMRRSRISIVQVKKLPSVSCEESVTTA